MADAGALLSTATNTTFPITFSETGLPAGTAWGAGGTETYGGGSVAGGQAPASVVVRAQNGTFSFEIDPVPGYYSAPMAGTLTVAGAPLSQSVVFRPGVEDNYSFTFFEANLANGSTWGMSVNGTAQQSTVTGPYGTLETFVVPNGTYDVFLKDPKGFAPLLHWPRLFTISGRNFQVLVAFAWAYPVTFSEKGLLLGTYWSIDLNGTANGTTTSSVGFEEPNGTGLYFWVVTVPTNYQASPLNGSVNVSGGPVNVTITFTEATYGVTFSETGLPGRIFPIVWSVTLNGTTNSSSVSAGGNSTPIVFYEPNGTGYAFEIGSVPGFLATPASGMISVAGAPMAETIVFTANPIPLAVREWTNVASRGGGAPYCVDGTGQVAWRPAWEKVTFAAAASNGAPPYAYAWTFGDGTPDGAGAQVNHTYNEFGTWLVNLTVTDSSGAINRTSSWTSYQEPNGTVPACAQRATVLGLPPAEAYLLIAGVAVAAVVAAVAIILRKRFK